MQFNRKTIVALALCAVTVFALCACGSAKTEISKSGFMTKADEMGLDVSIQPDVPEGIRDVAIVGKVQGSEFIWQIDYYLLDSADTARYMFNNIKDDLDAIAGAQVSATLPNSATYEKAGGGNYIYVSQIGKTLVYLNVPDQYKDQAKEFIKAIGY